METGTVSPKTDFDLILAFRAGKEHAFTELVARHKEKAVQIAYTILGNYEDAKDASQEAFVKVYRALEKFEMKSRFSTWLYRIIVNTAHDHARAGRWKKLFMNPLPSGDGDEAPDYLERVPDHSYSPGKNTLGRELGQRMNEAMAALPERQRLIFMLRYQEDLPLAEIARITGVSEGAVKASLHFASKKFKESMQEYLQEGSGHVKPS